MAEQLDGATKLGRLGRILH